MSDDEIDDWGNDWEETDDHNNNILVTKTSKLEITTTVIKKLYTLLDTSNLLSLQKIIISEVCDILGISVGDSMILLRYYNWKKQKLIDEWIEDSDKVRVKSGLSKVTLTRTISNPIKADPNSDYICNICTEVVKFSYTYSMSCNHRYCYDCWTNWVMAEMEKGPTVVYSVCPEHNCGEILHDDVFLKFLTPEKYNMYIKFNVMSFVTGSFTLKFCPGYTCNLAVEYNGGNPLLSRDVECTCGSKFCFGCVKVAHRPAPCDVTEQWLSKNESDSENANWILANTKICPKCKVPIEKNQGCNHMNCKLCKFEFCWLCKGDWSTHGNATGGFYSCNKFADKKDAEDEQKKVDKAANSLQRYLHYFSRYDNHGKATKIAETQLVKTQARMRELQDMRGAGFMDVQFLLQAVQTVISCRQVLQWTYAYGYYLEDNTPRKALFETFQEQLEKFTEHLHGLSEKPLDDLKEIKLRTEVINYTRVTEKFRDNIVKAVESNFADV